MSISFEFWAVVLPHAGLLAVVALIGAILAIARRSTDPHDRAEPGIRHVVGRDAPTVVLPLCRHDHRPAAARRSTAPRVRTDPGRGGVHAA